MENKVARVSSSKLLGKLGDINWNSTGRVEGIVGNIVEAKLPRVRLGSIASIGKTATDDGVIAEVVGFRDRRTLLIPYGKLKGVFPGAPVRTELSCDSIPAGKFLLGRVLDPFLRDLTETDWQPPAHCERVPIDDQSLNPMSRALIKDPMPLGISAIDALHTFCEGQRIGIMSGSGVGKSVLMGMIAQGSNADINVIGLIGERGREIKEFIQQDLGEEGLRRSVVISSTSDTSPLLRIRSARTATAIAEYFSSKGKKVLLMIDSLTRVAQAQREIGVAIGEPITTRGYPPSVFTLLPNLLERCGPQASGHGSISGIYTVLADGDDMNDPIPDATRAILDGHLVLSRRLAQQAHFPAIDIPASLSRLMANVVDREHLAAANRIKSLIATYEENFDYVQIGSYVHGSNPLLDKALVLMPDIKRFLKQEMGNLRSFEETIEIMHYLAEQAQ